MTPQERRELLGDEVLEHSRQVAAETTVWPPELLADLAVLLRRTPDTGADTSAVA